MYTNCTRTLAQRDTHADAFISNMNWRNSRWVWFREMSNEAVRSCAGAPSARREEMRSSARMVVVPPPPSSMAAVGGIERTFRGVGGAVPGYVYAPAIYREGSV
jgi:hypothetical protein